MTVNILGISTPEGETRSEAIVIATENLLKALDNTARSQWRLKVLQALQAAQSLGYSAGLRSAQLDAARVAREEEPAKEVAGSVATHQGSALPVTIIGVDLAADGEDRTLTKEGPTPQAELDKDVGYQFIDEIARQFGIMAREYDITPGCVETSAELINDHRDFVNKLAVHLFFRSPTLKTQKAD